MPDETTEVTEQTPPESGVFVSEYAQRYRIEQQDGNYVFHAEPRQIQHVPVIGDAAEGALEKALLKAPPSLWERVAERLGWNRKEEPTAFKSVGNHWLAVYSNNFEDREDEIFPTKAIDQFVARTDLGVVPTPEMWVWHAGKAVRVGQAAWVARHGHYTLAAGTWDDSPRAQKAKAYFEKPENARRTRLSHGFTFDPRQFDGKHYHAFNTFEISLLPRGKEANRYTSLERIKEMPLTEDKKKYIEDVFGKEDAEQILADLDKKGKALEELGVEFKDFAAPDTTGDKAAAEAVDKVETALKDLIPDLTEGAALAVQASLEAVKQVKELKATVSDQATVIADLKAKWDDRPRSASKDSETELTPERIVGLLTNVEKQNKRIDPLWGTEVDATEAQAN